MDKFWITIFILSPALLFNHKTNGQSAVEVQLLTRKFVEKGSSVTLFCKHNVEQKILHKVAWLKNGVKFFEYINGRVPPYRNFSEIVTGAEIDFPASNQHEVTLKKLDFEAAGLYHCEVSTESPIFTKASFEEEIRVYVPQTAPPRIGIKKRKFYFGEHLTANCSTTRARPAPHITWLINGKKVEKEFIKLMHPHPHNSSYGKSSHRSKSHQENQHILDKNDVNDAYNIKDPRDKKDEDTYSISEEKQKVFKSNHNDVNNHHKNVPSAPHQDDSYNKNSDVHKNNNRESNFYDNKYYETYKMHRKYRHLSDGEPKNSANVEERRTISSRGTYTASQINIQVSEQHADLNGRLEITCIATIPDHVSQGEQYADYKTFSIKIDVEAEPTTQAPSLAALGNSTDKLNSFSSFIILSYALIYFYKKLFILAS